jgi:hypothetical protein
VVLDPPVLFVVRPGVLRVRIAAGRAPGGQGRPARLPASA